VVAKNKRSQAYIEKTIQSGTARQKALLVANAFAEQLCGNVGFLTREQVDYLQDGLNTSREIKTFNRIIDAEYNIRIVIPFLINMGLELSERISFANGICLTHYTTGKFVDLLNNFCNEYGKDFRDKVINSLENNTLITGKMDESQEEPFLTLNNTYVTDEMMDSLKKQMTSSMAEIKAVITAIRDFMKKENIKIDPYTELLNEKEEELKEDASIIPKYGFKHLEDETLGEDLREYMKRFQLFPDYKNLPLDEDVYKQYIKALGGKDYAGPG